MLGRGPVSQGGCSLCGPSDSCISDGVGKVKFQWSRCSPWLATLPWEQAHLSCATAALSDSMLGTHWDIYEDIQTQTSPETISLGFSLEFLIDIFPVLISKKCRVCDWGIGWGNGYSCLSVCGGGMGNCYSFPIAAAGFIFKLIVDSFLWQYLLRAVLSHGQRSQQVGI